MMITRQGVMSSTPTKSPQYRDQRCQGCDGDPQGATKQTTLMTMPAPTSGQVRIPVRTECPCPRDMATFSVQIATIYRSLCRVKRHHQ